MSPVLSVVVPFYNVEGYLEACLESLERQTLRDIEVIMVDDGSLDGSEAIAKKFTDRDGRFRLVQQGNQGLGPARNTGVRHATGEFLCFADSDDVIPRYAYELMVGSLQETGSDIVSGAVKRIGANGLEESPLHKPIFKVTRKKTHVQRYTELLNDRTAWNKVFRRSFWDQHAFEFPPGLYEDAPVTVPAHALAGTVDVLKEVVYHWRIRETGAKSITQRRTEPGNLADRIRSVRSAADFLAGFDPALKREYDRLALHGDITIFINVLGQGDDAYRETFFGLVNGYLDGVDPALYRSLNTLERLKYHAIRNEMMDELVELVRFGKTPGKQRGAAVRRGGRFRSRWYADYPFFGDPRFPDELYALRRDLNIRAAIHALTWQDGKLRIDGYAFIDRLDAPEKADSRLQVELHRPRKGPIRQIVKVPTTRTRRPNATAATRQSTACYDWSGFVAEVDPARLGSAPTTWRVMVKVVTHGVRRRRWLYAPKGSARWPQAHEMPGGQIVTPRFRGDRLVLTVGPLRAQVTGAQVDGDTVELTGWVRAEDAEVVRKGRLLVRTRQGATSVRLPLLVTSDRAADPVPGRRGARGHAEGSVRTTFTARVPMTELDLGSGPTAELDSVDWDLFLEGPDKTKIRLPVRPDLAAARTSAGGHEYIVARTRDCHLAITERVPRLTVDEATWTPGAVRLTGTCPDPGTRPDLLILRRRLHSDVATSPLTWEGATFTAEVATGMGGRPLLLGRWELFTPLAGGEVAVSVDHRAAADVLPEPRVVGLHRHKLKTVEDIRLALLIEPALTPEERGRYAQARLQRQFYGPGNTSPLRDLVVFESYFGRQYSCNPAAIYEEMVRRNLDLDLVWASADGYLTVPGPGRTVLHGSTDYYESLSAAKVIVNNCLQPEGWDKRPGQFYLQTWHGTPYKHIAYDLVRNGRIASSTNRLERYEQDVPLWDLMISPGPHVTDMFRSALKFTCEVLEVGYPRNDMLFHADRSDRAAEIRAALGIPSGRRVVLYVPTWREDVFLQKGRQAELMLDTGAVATALAASSRRSARDEPGDGWSVLVRQHHLVADRTRAASGDVIDVTRYPDIRDLYLISDAVITDYSSVMFDFAATGRPLLFFTPDLEYYQNDLRGAYFDLAAEAPGPLLRTWEQVTEALVDLDAVAAEHAATYQAFRDRYCPREDGQATTRLVDRIMDALEGRAR